VTMIRDWVEDVVSPGWVNEEIALWIFIGALVMALLLITTGPAAELRLRGGKLPESSWGFSRDALQEHLQRIGDKSDGYKRDARTLYGRHLQIDSVFAIAYGLGPRLDHRADLGARSGSRLA
jgi:hypothetical protein